MSPLDPVPAQRLGDMSEEEFWAYAREQAGGDSILFSPENAPAGQYLECVLRRGTCLLPLVAVEEVIPSPHRYTLLPAIPCWVPGLASWRGEVAAIVNLEAYLSGIDMPSTGGLLLCTHYTGLALGLFVPAIGLTITLDDGQIAPPNDRLRNHLLDLDALLADVTQQIGMTARYA